LEILNLHRLAAGRKIHSAGVMRGPIFTRTKKGKYWRKQIISEDLMGLIILKENISTNSQSIHYNLFW